MPFGFVIQKRTPFIFAGRLRHRIDLVKLNSVQDSTGGLSTSRDVLYANIWASIEALSGAEKFAAHEFVSQVTHQVVIRYIGAAPSWQPLLNYPGLTLAKDSNGNLQQALAPGGISGTVAPVWNTNAGGFTNDGSPSTGLVWKNVGRAPVQTGVNAGMQILFQNRTFQIEAVLNSDERTKTLIMLCIEINDSLTQQQASVSTGDLN